jgi:hypothetical protein
VAGGVRNLVSKISIGTGLLNRNPCISSQFSNRSRRDCSSVSTPSATTLSFRASDHVSELCHELSAVQSRLALCKGCLVTLALASLDLVPGAPQQERLAVTVRNRIHLARRHVLDALLGLAQRLD